MHPVIIEKGIPMPTRGRGNVYPWGAMDIGDSFEVHQGTSLGHAGSLASIANKKFRPKRFASRKIGDGTYRIWRIE